MKFPTDEQVMTALCCGLRCKPGPNSGKCHRLDFQGEVARIRELLQEQEQTACTEKPSEAEEA